MANVPLKRKKGTNVIYHADRTAVNLYDTEIVAFNDRYIALNTGHWLTHTTIKRMNETSREFELGFYASRKNGLFQVEYDGNTVVCDGSRIKLTR